MTTSFSPSSSSTAPTAAAAPAAAAPGLSRLVNDIVRRLQKETERERAGRTTSTAVRCRPPTVGEGRTDDGHVDGGLQRGDGGGGGKSSTDGL